MFRYLNKKAQSTAEYVIVLGLIVAAVMVMQHEIKRAFQGRIKEAIDYVDDGGQKSGVVQFSGGQYEPGYIESDFDSKRNTDAREQMFTGGSLKRDLTIEHSEREGKQTIGLGEASTE